MTIHSTALQAGQPARPVSAAVAVPAADQTAFVPTAALVAARKLNFRKLLSTGAALAVLTGAAWYGWDYWTVGQYLVATDDAYVRADSTTIAPKVAGYLCDVLVKARPRARIELQFVHGIIDVEHVHPQEKELRS
jgi:membrane fusion protein (multidrug efflux system)